MQISMKHLIHIYIYTHAFMHAYLAVKLQMYVMYYDDCIYICVFLQYVTFMLKISWSLGLFAVNSQVLVVNPP